MASLWDRMRSWVQSNAAQLVWTPVPAGEDGAGLTPHDSYFRIWLSEAFLDKDKTWFTNHYPAVHASVRLNFGGEPGATFTSLSRPPEGGLGPGVYGNYALTSLLPYRGGTVELQAGLTAVDGANALAAAFSVVQDFSSLIGPPLGEALGIAGKVADGVQKLLDAGQDDVVLGLHQQYASAGGGGAHVLRPGYWALVRATEREVRPADLRVEGDRLRVAAGNGTTPLEGHDYILLRIEGRKERDDWRFKRFEDLIAKAIDAHYADNQPSYTGYRNAVLAEILSSPDLTRPDALRVATAVKRELDQAVAAGLGATGDGPLDLAGIVERSAPSRDEVAGMEALTVGDLLAGG
jgi:hypothetical protein